MPQPAFKAKVALEALREDTDQPTQAVRSTLIEQGWRLGPTVAFISDGEPALPNLVRAATGGPVNYILDWHISMRVRHIEQALAGIYALRRRSTQDSTTSART